MATLVGALVCRYAPFPTHPPLVWASRLFLVHLVHLVLAAFINFG